MHQPYPCAIKSSLTYKKSNGSSSSKQEPVNLTEPLIQLAKQKGATSKRNALLMWCQEKTQSYPDVDIKNFSASWNDGLAFCALIHSYLPQNIDYEALRDEKNPRKNFQAAFKAAQSVGIPQTLNIHELLSHERPEWNAVMNYVTLIYKHFELDDGSDELKTINTSGNSSINLSHSNHHNGSVHQHSVSRSPSSSPPTIRIHQTQQHLQLSGKMQQSQINSSASASSSSSSISKEFLK